MNIKTRELLLDRFEVMSRAADDCTYILTNPGLSKEEIKNKLYIRLDRINSESQVLEGYLKTYFKEPSNSIGSAILTTNPNIKPYI